MNQKCYRVSNVNSLANVLCDLFGGYNTVECPTRFGVPAIGMETVRVDQSVMPMPEKVIFNDPATIVYWNDGTKTVVKCQPGDVFSAETGLITAMLKKYMGNDNTFNRVVKEWLKRTGQYHPAPSVYPDHDCAETLALPDPDCVEPPVSEAAE